MSPPAFTSTPIISRQEEQTSHGLASQAIRAIFNRIEQLECGIKAIKKDILHQMESRLDDLKSSVVEMIEKIDSNRTYANVTKDSSSIQFIGQAPPENQLNMSASSNVDEGYGGQSSLNIIRSSSETQLKTVFQPQSSPAPIRSSGQCTENDSTQRRTVPAPANRNIQNQQRAISTPQPVPVRITNRNQHLDSVSETTVEQRNISNTSNSSNTLVVGDSIFKGVNRKGLMKGVRVCVKNGAMVKDIWDEISMYNLASFKNIIICVGGNDSSSRTEASSFEEKYDELLGFIKAANDTCNIYVCKVVPRGDVDVTDINYR